MIYFFAKDGQFRQVEVYLERPYTLACIDATGASQTERFGSATDLADRWCEVQHNLHKSWLERSFRPGWTRMTVLRAVE